MGGEDLDSGDAAEVAVVVAVGCPHHNGVVVAEVFSHEQAGPVGEDDVVFGEAFLGGGR